MNKLHFFSTLLILIYSNVLLAQIQGSNMPGMATPNKVGLSKLDVGKYVGDVNIFSGNYQNTISLGTVSTPGGLSYTANLNYNSKNQVSNMPEHVGGIPYGEGWSLSVPSITIKTASRKIAKKDFYKGQNIQYKRENFSNMELFEDGESYYYYPFLNIPGEVSGRLILKEKVDDRSIFVLNKFEKYVQAEFHNGVWDVILDDGRVFNFDYIKNNSRNAPNNRLDRFKHQLVELDIHQYDSIADFDTICVEFDPLDPNICLEEQIIEKYVFVKKFDQAFVDTKNDINQDLAKTIRPIIERTAWYPSQMYDPAKNDQMIFFQYETFGKINFHQEYLQNNFQFFFLEYVIEDVFDAYGDITGNQQFPVWTSSFRVPDLSNIMPYMKPYDKFNELGFIGNEPHNCGSVFREIYIKSIIAADMSNGYIPVEKIDLNYETFDVNSYANNNNHFSTYEANMLLWKNDPFVVRFDSLYSMKAVYHKGKVNDPNFLPFNANSTINFSNSTNVHWTRYRHLRSDEFLKKEYPQANALGRHNNSNVFDTWQNNVGSTLINSRNPYALKHNNSEYYFGREKIPVSNPTIPFDHSFLESERINISNGQYIHVPGDNYEIRTLIESNSQLMNFDIDLVTGDLNGITNDDYLNKSNESVVNGINIFANPQGAAYNYLEPEKVSATPKSISLFNTYNNLIKWSTGWSLNNQYKLYTSNNFTFPSLPHGFNGFQIRIGPATSDQYYNFGLKLEERIDLDDRGSLSSTAGDFSNYETYYSQYRNQEILNIGTPFAWNGSIHSYSSNPDNTHSRLWDTDPIPNNFGNGAPWYMMDQAQVAGYSSNWLDNNWQPKDYHHHRSWWNNFPLEPFCDEFGNLNGIGSNVGAFPNKPTNVDQSTALTAVQINRISKNPYILKEVKKYKLSGHYDYLAEYLEVDSIWDDELSEHLVFDYDIIQADNPGTWPLRKRNIFLLSEVSQLNLNDENQFISTQFEYEIDQGVSTDIPCNMFYLGCPNSNSKLTFVLGTVVLLNKITDNLGGETLIEYSDESQAVFSSIQGESWDFSSFIQKPIYDPNKKRIPPNIIREVVYPVSRIGKLDDNGVMRFTDYKFNGVITDGAMFEYNLFKMLKYNNVSFQTSISGFEKATIELPPLDPALPNKRAKIEYEHYGSFANYSNNWFETSDDHPYFLLGKVKSKKDYDENDVLIKEKVYTYKVSKAYANYYYRRKFWTSSTSPCQSEKVLANYNPGDQTSPFGEYYDLNLIKDGFGQSHANWYLKPNVADIRVTPFEDQKFMDAHDPPGVNSYFIRLVKEDVFDYYPVDNSIDNSNSTSRILEGGQRGYFHNVTEYSYYDADIYGRSNNDQYKKLLRKGIVGDPNSLIYLSDEHLYWNTPSIMHDIPIDVIDYRIDKSYQPSWQLSAKKSYSADDPGSYTLSEKYYMFDLQKQYRYKKLYGLSVCENETYPNPKFINDVREDAWMIKFHYDYLKRSSVFQTITTHHKAGMVDKKTLEFITYDDYKTGIVSIDPDDYDVKYKHLPQEFCDILGVSTGNNRTGQNDFPYYKDKAKHRSTYLSDRLKRNYQKSGIWEEYLLNEKGIKPKDIGNKDIELDNVFLNVSVLKTAHISIDDLRKNEFNNNVYSDHRSDIKVNEDFLFYEDTEIELLLPNIKIRHLPDGSIEYYSDALVPVTTHRFIPKIPFNNIQYADVIGRNRFGQPMIVDDQKDIRTLLEFPGRSYTWITDPVKTMKKYEYADPDNGDYTIVLKDVACRYRVMNFGKFGVPESKIEGFGRNDALETNFTFDNRYNLTKIKDPNKLITEYSYDGFNRLKETKVNGLTINSYDYSYWNSSEAGNSIDNFHERSSNNYVDVFNHFEDSTTLFTRSYTDPLGREFHTATNIFNFNSGNFTQKTIHSGSVVYDQWDRPLKNYKPFKSLYTSINPEFNYSGYYTEKLMEGSTRGLTFKTSDFGVDIHGSHAVHSYTSIIDRNTLGDRIEASNLLLDEIAPGTSRIFKQITSIDQDGKKSRIFLNSIGQKVAQTSYLANSKINTYFVYDAAGNLHKSINDKGQVREYYFNSLGLVYKTIDPDAGVTLSWYDNRGNIEFTQDENLRSQGGGYIRKFEYDKYGRLLRQKKIGLVNNISSSFNFNRDLKSYTFDGIGTVFQLGNSTFEKRFNYGKPDVVRDYIRDEIYDEFLCAKYAKGKLTRSESFDESGMLTEVNYIFYNEEGLQKAYASQFNPNGITSTEAGILNRIYYNYDRQGRLIEKKIDLHSDNILDFNYGMSYDNFSRLTEVRGGLQMALNDNHKLLNYTYDDVRGHVIRKRYFFHDSDQQNTQEDEMIYAYEPKRDRLRALRSSMMDYQLYYDDDTIGYEQFEPFGSTQFSGDYLSYTNNFNGNINGIQFTLKDPNIHWKTFYGYKYDSVNRLVNADAFIIQDVGSTDDPSSYSPNGNQSRFKIGDVEYQYDDIGNLEFKKIGRWGDANNFVLFDVVDPVLPTANNKFRNANGVNNAFTYDNNGNVTMDLIRNNVMYYGRANLPHTLINNGLYTYYKYNSSDSRIYKKNDLASENTGEYYFKDQGNQVVAIFTENHNNGSVNWEHYLYGNENFAKFNPRQTQIPDFNGYDFIANRAMSQAGSYVLSSSTKYIDNSNFEAHLHQNNLILGGGNIEFSDFNLCNDVSISDCLEYEFQDDHLNIKGAKVIFKANTILKPEAGFRIKVSTINIAFGNCETSPDMLTTYEDTTLKSLTYYQRDHLGNTRLAYKVENSLGTFHKTLTHALDYYPFGKILREYNLENEKFKFTGKERDAESGYDYFEARLYDSDFGRFLQVDPLGAKFPTVTPYSYAMNNPIRLVDPTGKEPCPNGDCGDVVNTPRIRSTNGNKNKSRFRKVDRVNSDGSKRQHHGVDILAKKGENLKSLLDGEVVDLRDTFKPGEYAKNSFGNYVITKSVINGENVFTKYAHLDEVSVVKGSKIKSGSIIGQAGNTGNAANLSAGEHHVHLESSEGGNSFSKSNRVNPEKYMKTKFNSYGNPINPERLTTSESSSLISWINELKK